MAVSFISFVRETEYFYLHHMILFFASWFIAWNATLAHLQVFFDLMREIRSRKIEDKSASNGRGKDRAKRKKKKCIIL